MRRVLGRWIFLVGCWIFLSFLPGCEQAPPPGAVTVLTEETFDKAIAKGVVLVDFWADWCVPCRTQRVIVAEVAAQASGKGVRVANLDLGYAEAREKVEHLNIEYVPTLIVFKKGKPFKTFEGLTQKDALIEAINDAKAAK
ncbi:MAG: thioredoxin domain-containing protein [Kiritimatiellaeota bacterium]|nr:thioredoxin domain-containing protein [Kiritimatiellota bacterium]